jgi:O-antigen/teichoic acid export membrane protein
MRPRNFENGPPDKEGSSELLRTAAGGSAVAMLGSMVGRGLGFCIKVLICRIFAPSYFGQFFIGSILCQVLRYPFSLGLQKGAMRFLSIAYAKKDFASMPAIVTLATLVPAVVGSIGGLCLFLLSDWISTSCYHDPSLSSVLKAFSIALPFSSLMMIGSELTRSFKTTKYSVMIEEIVFPSVQISLLLALHQFGMGSDAVVYSFIVASMIAAAFALLIVLKQLRREMGAQWSGSFFAKHSIQFPLWREILLFSMPFMPIGMSLAGFHFSDILILKYFMSPEDVGLYAGAASIAMLFASLIRTTNQVFAPLIAMQYGVEDVSHIDMLYKSLTRWMFYASFPALIFVIIAREPIMLSMGPNFAGQIPMALAILSFGHVFVVATGGAGLVLTMTAHAGKELWTIIAGLILNIGLNVVLIPSFGLLGAALSATISRIAINLVRIVIVYRIFHIRPWTSAFRLPIAMGVLGLGLHAVISVRFTTHGVLDIVFGLFASLAVLWAIMKRGLEDDDKALLMQVWRKVRGKGPGPMGRPLGPGGKPRPLPGMEGMLDSAE